MTDTQTLLKHINLYNLTKEQYESMLENGEIDSNAFYYLRDDTSLIDIKTNSDNILNLQNIINAKTSSVISGSSNLMTSGGVYSALGASTLSSGILNSDEICVFDIMTTLTFCNVQRCDIKSEISGLLFFSNSSKEFITTTTGFFIDSK